MAKSKQAAVEADWRETARAVSLVALVLGTLLLGAVLQADSERPAPPPAAARATDPAPAGGPADATVVPGEAVSEPTADRSPASPAPTEPEPPSRSRPEVAPAGAAASVPFRGDADLVDRAAEDERRLQASGNGFTLQFAVNCEAQNVRANLDVLRDDPDFYLITMLYRDRVCFRLCWGFYDTEQQARAVRDVPGVLAAMTAKPKVISIAEALP